MIQLECPMCEGQVLVTIDAAALYCDGCVTTVDVVDRSGDEALPLAA
jgi:hypothetical protein